MSDEGNNPPQGSGFTLDGKPVDDSLPEGWGRPERRVGRIGEWGGSSNVSSGRNTPERKSKKGEEAYTGGERSGLAVQYPGGPPRQGDSDSRSVVDDILRQAADNGPSTENRSADSWTSMSGNTLGSDEAASVAVNPPTEENVQRRTITFWADGFSIEDGELYSYDDPQNKELLAAIHAGRAPISLFNVRFDQPLELVVSQRTNEKYAPPPKILKPFGGGGNRLGSATPEIAGTPSFSVASRPQSASPAPAAPADSKKITVDDSKPATNVQIRLADGSRVVARVNLDHTVGDLRSYISSTRPTDREYVLQTTFPSRELADAETVAEAKLANAVMVQRYK